MPTAALLLFAHDSLKGPTALSLRYGYPDEQFHRKPGQYTMTASKVLKQQDTIFLSV